MKALLFFLALIYLIVPVHCYALFGSDEMNRLEEQIRLLKVKLSLAKDAIREYEQKLPALQEENTRLRVELAGIKSSLDGGKMLDEEKKSIEKRLEELKRRETYLQQKEMKLLEEMQQYQEREKAFFEAANETQRKIGRAEQLKQDYEYMRTARNEAEAKLADSQQQITYYSQRLVYALVIFGMIILGAVAWVVYIISQHTKQKAEIQAELASINAEEKKRHDAIQIWQTQASLPEDERQKVKAALEKFLK